MAATDLPSPSELHKYLSYDPETGELRWKARTPEMFATKFPVRDCNRWNATFAGKPALVSVREKGYLYGEINEVKARAHRVAWAMHYGAWPEDQIDHINGVPSDNRIANLRDVTPSVNRRNTRKLCTTTCGYAGVRSTASGKWAAHMRLGSKQISLGTYESRFDAVLARLNAEKENGFSIRHGLAA